MDLRTLRKVNRQEVFFFLFLIMVFILFLVDAMTTKVNICKINNGEIKNFDLLTENSTNTSCMTIPIKVFPLLKE